MDVDPVSQAAEEVKRANAVAFIRRIRDSVDEEKDGRT
jgi:hypothetical protein